MSRVNLVIAAHDLSIDDAVRSPPITRDFVLEDIDVESFESALGRLDDRQFAAVLIASAYGYGDRVLSGTSSASRPRSTRTTFWATP